MKQWVFYHEKLYSTDENIESLLSEHQESIVEVLLQNQAVGVIGGFYEKSLPLYFISEFMLTNLGMTYEEFMKKTKGNYMRLVYAKDKSLLQHNYDARGNICREYRLMRGDDNPVWVREVRQNALDLNGRPMWIASVRVIDDVHRREQEIQALLSEEYSAIAYIQLNNKRFEWVKVPDLRVTTNGIGTVADFKRDMNIYIREFIHEEELEFRDTISAVMTSLQRSEFPSVPQMITYKRLNRNRYEWMQLQIMHGGDCAMDTGYVVLTFRNIDGQVRKEMDANYMLNTALRKYKKTNEAAGRFVAGLTHDMKGYLGQLLQAIESCEQCSDMETMQRKYLPEIKSAAKQFELLVEEASDIHDMRSGNLKVEDKLFNLNILAEQIRKEIKPILKARNQTAKLSSVAIHQTEVTGDYELVNKLVCAVVREASKIFEEGCDVYADIVELPRQLIGYAHYQVSICDFDIRKMVEDRMRAILDVHSEEGDIPTEEVYTEGLGMAMVYNMVKLLRGDLVVDRRVGYGVEFVLTLELKIREEGYPGFTDCR